VTPPRGSRRVLAACVAVAALLGGVALSVSEGGAGGRKPAPAARESREAVVHESAGSRSPAPAPPTLERRVKEEAERENRNGADGAPMSAGATRSHDNDVDGVPMSSGATRSHDNEATGAPMSAGATRGHDKAGGAGDAAGGAARPPGRAPVALARLDVTEGELRPGPDGLLTVDGPRMRAVVPGTTAASAELRFTVLGPTVQQVALASGEQRQQVGLKLRALDGCNLVYVMWRLAPKPGVVVNYKRNPGKHTSRECGNGGYTTVRPVRRVSLDAPASGKPHTLRAALDGRVLRVWADDQLAWEGALPEEALAIDGPVGLRSDNVRVALQLFSPLP
jgi:hypothetical protein